MVPHILYGAESEEDAQLLIQEMTTTGSGFQNIETSKGIQDVIDSLRMDSLALSFGSC